MPATAAPIRSTLAPPISDHTDARSVFRNTHAMRAAASPTTPTVRR